MKKGGTTGIVIAVLIIGILGAVLLYSGTSAPTTAQVTREFTQSENDGDCECQAKCEPNNPNVAPHGFFSNEVFQCQCQKTVANSCDGTCQSFLAGVVAANPGFTCTLTKASNKCTGNPKCDEKVRICHCPDNDPCFDIEIAASGVPAHLSSLAHPPKKDTLGPCCGNGKKDNGERCDPTANPTFCDEKCTSECECPETTTTTTTTSTTTTTFLLWTCEEKGFECNFSGTKPCPNGQTCVPTGYISPIDGHCGECKGTSTTTVPPSSTTTGTQPPSSTTTGTQPPSTTSTT